jgi:hypothetical protein
MITSSAGGNDKRGFVQPGEVGPPKGIMDGERAKGWGPRAGREWHEEEEVPVLALDVVEDADHVVVGRGCCR